MKKLILGLLFALLPVLAHAESLVVQTCGTNPQSYAVGATRLDTVDVNGNKCTFGAPVAAGSGTAGLPAGATAISASSGNVANAAAFASLAAAVGKVTYLCGFSFTSTGSTAATVVSPSVTNVINGPMTFTYASVAGVTLANTPLTVTFNPCLPAGAQNISIPVQLPALGAGNTNATAVSWGFQQ